jgi:hypothetical protein
MMHDLHIPITTLHQYPVSTQESYLLEPDKWKNLLDLDVIERTFLGENKQYWSQVAKANIRAVAQARQALASGKLLWDEQEEPLVPSQIEYKTSLENQIIKSKICFKEANKRRKKGFGIFSNVCKETLPLRVFYLKLWAFISNTEDNVLFKNNIAGRALNPIRKGYFYEEYEEDGFGVDNHAFIKRIVANINFIELHSYEFIKLKHLSEKLGKDLALFAKGKYKTPTFANDIN